MYAGKGESRMRTIVFSDAHGEPAVIRRVMEHSGHRPGVDRLIFAGDAIDVGRDSWGCLELLDELGAEFLVGNHEFSAWDGHPIEPANVDMRVQDAVTRRIDSGTWLLAANAEGVLVTHGGLCESLGGLGAVAPRDTEGLVAALNDAFAAAIRMGPGGAAGSVVYADGPLWYRPSERLHPLSTVTQVAGHTPAEILPGGDAAAVWAERGFHLIDPFVRGWAQGRAFSPPVPLRYAVIENGEVSVVDGA